MSTVYLSTKSDCSIREFGQSPVRICISVGFDDQTNSLAVSDPTKVFG